MFFLNPFDARPKPVASVGAKISKWVCPEVDNQPAYWLVGEAMGKTQPYSGIPPTRRCYPLDRIPTKKLYDKHRQISGYRVLIGAA